MSSTAHAPQRPSVPNLRPWWIAVGTFYLAWFAVVVAGGHWSTIREHWGIAVAMLAGSYVAGSTPMGGGTVAFPILVLLFHQPAALGRDFSFAIQSLGMSSATLFLLCRRQALERTLLLWGMLGSAVGTPLGILLLAPAVPAVAIKLLFAVIWASFGVLHFARLREFTANQGLARPDAGLDRKLGLIVGFVGGSTVAAVTGVGTEMLAYVVLVLLRRTDLRIAIPTAVILAAFTSVVAMVTKLSTTGIQAGVFENWIAAAPVVVVGAPIGAFLVSVLGRSITLYVVAVLCLGQFVWTIQQEWSRMGGVGLGAGVAGVVVFNLAFEALRRRGHAGSWNPS